LTDSAQSASPSAGLPAGERVLGVAHDCSELIEIYRQRKAELGLTDRFFDESSGLARGHVGKLLGAARVKGLGASSIRDMNSTLALKFIVVVDSEAEEFMRDRWEKRLRPAARASREAPLGKVTMKRVRPVVLRELSRLGNAARQKALAPSHRRRIAQLAAKARWSRRSA
jgi:hypothetical protein